MIYKLVAIADVFTPNAAARVQNYLHGWIPALVPAPSGGCSAFVGGVCPANIPAGVTSFYFIDPLAGADTNTGSSEAAALAHSPGMTGCASTCASITPTAGTGFIFKGGNSTGSSAFPWTWSWSGTSGAYLYLGYDPAWFTGGSFSRAIMDCQGTCAKQLQQSGNQSFVQVDNFEWKGLFSSAASPAFGDIYSINFHNTSGSNPGYVVSNNYFHGWNVAHDGTQDAILVIWSTGTTDNNSQFYSNVADGSDGTGAAPNVMLFLYGSPGFVYQNYAGHMSNAYVNGCPSSCGSWVRSFHDNFTEYILVSVDGATHENMFESNGDGGTIAYNNVFQHGQFSGLVVFMVAPYVGDTSYAFNNVLWDIWSPNGQQCYEGSPSSGTCQFFNNTSQCGATGSSTITCGRATGTGTGIFTNEHFITSISPISGGSATVTTPTTQTQTAANAQGYNATQTYAYSPTTGGSTIGAGTNVQSSLCAAVLAVNSAAGNACKNDTTYACTYVTASHTMSCPARVVNAQPTTGAQDTGAYRFSTAAPPPPAPATTMFSTITVNPLPAQVSPPVPTLTKTVPLNTYFTSKGFSQDGKTFTQTLSVTFTGTNLNIGADVCTIDGTTIPCTCSSSTVCVATISASAIAVPTKATAHSLGFSVATPAATPIPVLQ